MSIEVNKSELTKLCDGVYKKNDKTFYIECIVNGTMHYCNKVRLDKLIKKNGSIEAIGSSYISRNAKNSDNAKISPNKPANENSKKVKRTNLPKPSQNTLYSVGDYTVYDIFSSEGTLCIRPDVIRTNNGYCNGCRWFAMCRMEQKKFRKYKEQANRNIEIPQYPHPVMTEGIEIG